MVIRLVYIIFILRVERKLLSYFIYSYNNFQINPLFSDFESQTGHCINCLLITYTVTTDFHPTLEYFVTAPYCSTTIIVTVIKH